MQWKSSPDRYGAVPIAIHWISALAIIIMLTSGLVAANAGDAAAKASILRVHVIVGTCVLILTSLRIVWWLAIDRRPNDKAGLPGWQASLSHVVHYALYAVILAMLSSGVALALLSGLIPILFGGASAVLPNFAAYPPLLVHDTGGWVMLGLLAAHIGAALYHQFGRRDHLLARMGIGSK
jgi:cytochrome b561